jgi:hypothetical protein
MRIDWVISVVTFLMFVMWAFSHYSLLGSSEIISRADSALLAAEKITDYMEVGLSSTPANITAPADANVTVWAYMNWTGDEANSTRVVTEHLSNESLQCEVDGDRLYWKANLTTGDNYFFIENIDWELAMNCDQTIAPTNDNQTELWATESSGVFSADKNGQRCAEMNQSYQSTKRTIGVAFDFNVLVESGSSMECGIPLPAPGRDVFVFPVTGSLWNGGDVNITVRLW